MTASTLKPETGFSTFSLSPEIRRGIEVAGYLEPRPIQWQTIPAALAGRDILGLAQTGTGKTAAFVLPILERLGRHQAGPPRVLVVAPTRELALQIAADFESLGQFTPIRVTTIFGGVSANKQVKALREQPDVVIACPGRLLDLYSQKAVRLDRIEILVLDEADHMFDMGFIPDVRRIIAALPRQRQTMLFSATMPPEIRGLAEQNLKEPHRVELAHSQPASTIEHALYPVDEKRKHDLLRQLLGGDDFVSAIVFTRTKHRAKRLAHKLIGDNVNAVALQGNMSQNARERAMGGFRRREFDVLVATDIAARGLDIEQVSHVINFDMPNTPDAYTHRIGRTGRAERSGRACTFVTADDHEMVRAVEKRIGQSIARRVVPGFEGGGTLTRLEPARSGGRSHGATEVRRTQRSGSGAPSAYGRRRGRGGRSGSGSSSAAPRRAAR